MEVEIKTVMKNMILTGMMGTLLVIAYSSAQARQDTWDVIPGKEYVKDGLPFDVWVSLKTDQPPVLDGKLDDACWQKALPMLLLVQTCIEHSMAVWIAVDIGKELRANPTQIIPQLLSQLFLGLRSEIGVQGRSAVAVGIAKP